MRRWWGRARPKALTLLILSPTHLMFFSVAGQSSFSPVVCLCACMSGHCSHFLSMPTVITAAWLITPVIPGVWQAVRSSCEDVITHAHSSECEACAERVQGPHVSGLVHWIPAKQQLTIQASLSELASSLCTSMAESFPLHRDLSCTLTSLWQKVDHDDITSWVFFFPLKPWYCPGTCQKYVIAVLYFDSIFCSFDDYPSIMECLCERRVSRSPHQISWNCSNLPWIFHWLLQFSRPVEISQPLWSLHRALPNL